MTGDSIEFSLGYTVMVRIEIEDDRVLLEGSVETFYQKEVKPLGNAGRIQARKQYIGHDALVIILTDEDSES